MFFLDFKIIGLEYFLRSPKILLFYKEGTYK